MDPPYGYGSAGGGFSSGTQRGGGKVMRTCSTCGETFEFTGLHDEDQFIFCQRCVNDLTYSESTASSTQQTAYSLPMPEPTKSPELPGYPPPVRWPSGLSRDSPALPPMPPAVPWPYTSGGTNQDLPLDSSSWVNTALQYRTSSSHGSSNLQGASGYYGPYNPQGTFGYLDTSNSQGTSASYGTLGSYDTSNPLGTSGTSRTTVSYSTWSSDGNSSSHGTSNPNATSNPTSTLNPNAPSYYSTSWNYSGSRDSQSSNRRSR
ncbi:hypothetical protein B0J13DRAFT_518732 [Dactylonectria estremocensis]|uniref:Uncharacterized protein n=1 Tax=Dactylonectria estremocensis TaxID=1079267 RepID=A0A9P9FJS0_9HYPO|nr:hypothetical protein B0J13DRAFT_518732 [Dactylonectria estremocensis]